MIPSWWSWLLTVVGVTGIYLTTKHLWYGFLIGVLAQFLWISYAIATQQWGFIVSAFAYGTVNAIGLWRWTRVLKEPDEAL